MPSIQETLTSAINLHNAGRLREAEQKYQEVVAIAPTNARAWHLLGMTEYQLGSPELAVNCAQRSLALQPGQADVHNNLGLFFHDLGLFDHAADSYQRALAIDPAYGIAHDNLGRTLLELRRMPEALDSYKRAAALLPGSADIHLSVAIVSLLLGDFCHGWQEYEWRFNADASDEFALLQFKNPRWSGEPLTGKTILLHSEQGLGDTIQFVRYAPRLQAMGATVLLGCKKPLRNLLASCAGVRRLISEGDALPNCDFYAPLLSLPRRFNTTLATIPAQVPYVFADPTLVGQWREQLAHLTGLRIGINWHGRGGQGSFRKRDLPLEQFVTLSSHPGLQLVCLQKEIDAAESAQLAGCPSIYRPPGDFDTAHGAFMDTAAIMKNLDLVITSDTAIAHLAGALGVPVWVALPYIPDWRWLLDRSDSPWYPTMRLFRQKSAGNWTQVFEEIKSALQTPADANT